MEARISKKEQLEIFETRWAKKRQHLEAKQRRHDEEGRQLEEEWQRHKEDYETQRTFLDELWREHDSEESELRLEETQDAPTPQQVHRPNANGTGRRSISEEVLIIVDDWQDDSIITQSEVTQKFLEKYPDRRPSSLVSSISHTLSQLASSEDGTLELVEKGAGSRPSKYRKRVRTVNVGP
jgi:hypothetical protein